MSDRLAVTVTLSANQRRCLLDAIEFAGFMHLATKPDLDGAPHQTRTTDWADLRDAVAAAFAAAVANAP